MGLPRISIGVTEEEFAAIQAAAKDECCSVNKFLRRIINDSLAGIKQVEKGYWKEREMRYMEKYIDCSISNIVNYTLDNLGLEIADLRSQISKLEHQIIILQKQTENVKYSRSHSWKRR